MPYFSKSRILTLLAVLALGLLPGRDLRDRKSFGSRTIATVGAEQIPQDCLEPALPSDAWEVHTTLSVGASRTELSSPEVGGQLIFIAPRCVNTLQVLHQNTLTRFMLEPSHRPAFPYHPSANRSYCGTEVEPRTCEYIIPEDTAAIISLDDENVPFSFENQLEILRHLPAGPLPASTLHELTFIVTQEPLTRNALRVVQRGLNDESADGDGRPVVLREGYISFLKAKTSVFRNVDLGRAATPFRQRADNQLFQFARDALNYTSILAELPPSTATQVQTLRDRAELLIQYWNEGKSFFDVHRNELTTPNVEISRFESRATNHSYGLDPAELTRMGQLTRSLVREAAITLTYSRNYDELLDAAGVWWASRWLEIKSSCDSRNEGNSHPFAGAEFMVRLQYMHQTCRRYYTNDAFLALNQAIQNDGNVELSGRPWTIVMALGSRQERADLFRMALPQLSKQIKNGRPLNARDLGILVREVLQVQEELRLRKVVLWTGLKTFASDGSDLNKLNEFIAEFSRFLTDVTPWVVKYWTAYPDLFQNMRLTWSWLAPSLNLPAWDARFPQLRNGATLNEGVTSILREPINADSRPWPPEKVHALFQMSFEIMAGSPEQERPLCRTWLHWLSRHREEFREVPRMPAEGEVENCLTALREWSEVGTIPQSPDPNALAAQCEAGHHLSCYTSLHLTGGADANSARLWEQILNRPPQVLTAQLPLVRLFRRHLRRGMQSRDRAAWVGALSRIHSRWRTQVESQLMQFPSEQEMGLCVSPAEALNFIAGLNSNQTIASQVESFPLLNTCPVRAQTAARAGISNLIFLKRMESAGALWASTIAAQGGRTRPPIPLWQENLISALLRYNEFVSILQGELRDSVPRSRIIFSDTVLTRVMQNMNPYFHHADNGMRTASQSWWFTEGESVFFYGARHRLEMELSFLRMRLSRDAAHVDNSPRGSSDATILRYF